MAKTCTNCKETHMKVEKYFYKDKSRKDGFQPYCMKCSREITAYYEEKGKPAKEKRTCQFSKCNNTFETRVEKKQYCCISCRTKAYQERTGVEKVRFRQNFLKKLKRSKEINPNKNKPWTFDEDTILLDMRVEKKKYREIGEVLKRSSDACSLRHLLLKKKAKRQ